jgi:hypothetical protein
MEKAISNGLCDHGAIFFWLDEDSSRSGSWRYVRLEIRSTDPRKGWRRLEASEAHVMSMQVAHAMDWQRGSC